MELTYHVDVAFFDLLLCLLSFFSADRIEPVVKHFRVGENLRQKEVKQTPQLVEIVL